MKKAEKSIVGNSKVAIKDCVLSRKESNNTTSVMNLDTNDFFVIDGVAAEAWFYFTGKNSIKRIVREISAKHDLADAETEKEIINFANKLLKHDLVEMGS